MKTFQPLLSPALPLTSFHDLLALLFSPSVALRHVLFGLPLLLYPWEFQSNAVFSVAPVHLRVRNVCPIQLNFFLFVLLSIDSWWAILHNSSFVILSVHFIFIICLKHLLTDMCSVLVAWLVGAAACCEELELRVWRNSAKIWGNCGLKFKVNSFSWSEWISVRLATL
jgi:hypothetical protein